MDLPSGKSITAFEGNRQFSCENVRDVTNQGWGERVAGPCSKGDTERMRFSATLLLLARAACAQPIADGEWPAYGRDPGGSRYSPLRDINRANVSSLRVVWTYHTGALQPETKLNRKAAFEATPILFEGTLYLSTPYDQVIALDPATGAERWKYDPGIDRKASYSEVTSRGVSGWTDPAGKTNRVCHSRIFIGTIGARLIALDAKTGKPCEAFGAHGQIDL